MASARRRMRRLYAPTAQKSSTAATVQRRSELVIDSSMRPRGPETKRPALVQGGPSFMVTRLLGRQTSFRVLGDRTHDGNAGKLRRFRIGNGAALGLVHLVLDLARLVVRHAAARRDEAANDDVFLQ